MEMERSRFAGYRRIAARGRHITLTFATVGFALMQAAAAYGLSFVFARNGGDYRPLFLIGSAAMVAALALDLATAAMAKKPGLESLRS